MAAKIRPDPHLKHGLRKRMDMLARAGLPAIVLKLVLFLYINGHVATLFLLL